MNKHGYRLNVEQHREIGDSLFRTQREMCDVLRSVFAAFPSKSKVSRNVESVYQLLWQIRSDLEDAMYKECANDHDFPRERIERLSIYYPGSDA